MIKLYNDECLNILKSMEDNFVDAVITDPPYGINFMGKKWDYDVPSVEIWKEVLRVMKPGSTLLCFAGTRTQHRMAVNIEDAGFILKDVIMWLYGSGFPKATDISKQLDKGVERKVIEVTKAKNSMGRLQETSKEQGARKYTKGFSEELNVKKYGGIPITAPATEKGKLWNGWKSHGLKPAYEPIIMAMKPNDGSYAENALKWGVSGVNINDCRIGTEIRKNMGMSKKKPDGAGVFRDDNWVPKELVNEVKGRFPANIILSHHPECELMGIYGKYNGHEYEGSLGYGNEEGKEVIEDWECHEDCPIRMIDEQSGILKTGGGNKRNTKPNLFRSNIKHRNDEDIIKSNSGGASRFFYCAKASKSERDIGCENLEEKKGSDNYRPNDDGTKGIQSRLHGATIKGSNNHPTVKPIGLMEYLCKLVSMPEKITVLDPYMGSGTTGIACINVGLDFIGIEKELEYFEIAQTRLNHVKVEKIDKVEESKNIIDMFFD